MEFFTVEGFVPKLVRHCEPVPLDSKIRADRNHTGVGVKSSMGTSK